MTTWRAELRTRLAGVDPGRTRLHLATVAIASMITAAVLAAGMRVLTGQPVVVVLLAVVLAMISNVAVTETELGRRRVTTALMLLPAAASATASAVLAEHRIAANVVFVLVMVVAVAVRRYGPRGVALGMAAFIAYFFVQFLGAGPAALPGLLAASVIGIGSTFVLRCLVFTRPVSAVLDALVRAFEARLRAVVLDVLEVVAAGRPDPEPGSLQRGLARLNETALLVADRLDEADGDPVAGRPGHLPGGARPGGPDAAESEIAGLRQWIVDSELAAERLAMSVRRSVEHRDPLPPADRAALAGGIRALAAATAAGTPRAMASALYENARREVEEIVERPPGPDAAARGQRIAFAVRRLADAMQSTVEQAGNRIAGHRDAEATGGGDRAGEAAGSGDSGADRADGAPGGGLALHTRQAVQVGIATGLAIVVGELIWPARWYWAVIAAFIVFAGTTSRGDVLSRGWARALGTAGGVVAGMLLALLAGGNLVASLVLLLVCVFLALYLVRISQAMMAFWLTAVLALVYGVIGQFSVETLLLRVEETVVGGALGMLAAFLVLPTRSRTAFAEALDDALVAVGESLRRSADRILDRDGAADVADPLAKAREVDTAVATVRERARPLEHPVARRPLRRGVHHTVRVVGALDHYTRLLAAQAAGARSPGWTETLDPAVERVCGNVDALRRILNDGWGPPGRREHGPGADPADYGVGSAEELVDAAEGAAAGAGGERDRAALLGSARMLRRIDQLAVGLARELCGRPWSEPAGSEPSAPPGQRAGAG